MSSRNKHIASPIHRLRLRMVICLMFALVLSGSMQAAVRPQPQNKILRTKLALYFENYTTDAYTSNDKIKIENIITDAEQKTMQIYVNEGFSSQPFTPQVVENIYRNVSAVLPAPYNTYQLTIFANGYAIQDLIPANLSGVKDASRIYQQDMVRGNPWVTP